MPPANQLRRHFQAPCLVCLLNLLSLTACIDDRTALVQQGLHFHDQMHLGANNSANVDESVDRELRNLLDSAAGKIARAHQALVREQARLAETRPKEWEPEVFGPAPPAASVSLLLERRGPEITEQDLPSDLKEMLADVRNGGLSDVRIHKTALPMLHQRLPHMGAVPAGHMEEVGRKAEAVLEAWNNGGSFVEDLLSQVPWMYKILQDQNKFDAMAAASQQVDATRPFTLKDALHKTERSVFGHSAGNIELLQIGAEPRSPEGTMAEQTGDPDDGGGEGMAEQKEDSMRFQFHAGMSRRRISHAGPTAEQMAMPDHRGGEGGEGLAAETSGKPEDRGGEGTAEQNVHASQRPVSVPGTAEQNVHASQRPVSVPGTAEQNVHASQRPVSKGTAKQVYAWFPGASSFRRNRYQSSYEAGAQGTRRPGKVLTGKAKEKQERKRREMIYRGKKNGKLVFEEKIPQWQGPHRRRFTTNSVPGPELELQGPETWDELEGPYSPVKCQQHAQGVSLTASVSAGVKWFADSPFGPSMEIDVGVSYGTKGVENIAECFTSSPFISVTLANKNQSGAIRGVSYSSNFEPRGNQPLFKVDGHSLSLNYAARDPTPGNVIGRMRKTILADFGIGSKWRHNEWFTSDSWTLHNLPHETPGGEAGFQLGLSASYGRNYPPHYNSVSAGTSVDLEKWEGGLWKRPGLTVSNDIQAGDKFIGFR